MPEVGTTQSWFLLSRVDVVAPDATGAIVAFGDSITDGARSTPDTNSRWPDQLARRLQAQGIKMGVLNAGIGGNRVLSEAAVPAGVDARAVGAGINALARFERHVLSLPGVTHVIVLEGINDIGNARQNPTPTAADLIAAHKQLIEQAHARGIKIIGATLTPFWGAAYYTEAGEAKRQALNEWIRTGKALRRRRRFRQGDARSERSEEAPREIRFVRLPAPERRRLQGDGRRDRSVALQDRAARHVFEMTRLAAGMRGSCSSVDQAIEQHDIRLVF